MITEAIILAGGLGTRLRSAVPDLPKCMAPVAGKPFLSYVIEYLKRQGIGRFIFCLGYKHEMIEQYLKKEHQTLEYKVSIEREPLGTGGAVYQGCLEAFDENVIILNGDTYFEVDLQALSSFHIDRDADCTICLKEMFNTDRYGVVETGDDHRISLFKEKQFYDRCYINGGVYALNVRSFLKQSFPQKFSFEKEYFEQFYREKNIYGLKQHGYFIDIGIPEDFEKAQTDLLNA